MYQRLKRAETAGGLFEVCTEGTWRISLVLGREQSCWKTVKQRWKTGVPDNEQNHCGFQTAWLSSCRGNGRSFTQCAVQPGETLVASLDDTLKIFSSLFFVSQHWDLDSVRVYLEEMGWCGLMLAGLHMGQWKLPRLPKQSCCEQREDAGSWPSEGSGPLPYRHCSQGDLIVSDSSELWLLGKCLRKYLKSWDNEIWISEEF